MRAVVMREFGPPEVLRLEEVAEPDGEVLVEVAFASVTFVETMVRAGRAPHPSMAPSLPAILGNGVAGTAGGARVVTTTGMIADAAARVGGDRVRVTSLMGAGVDPHPGDPVRAGGDVAALAHHARGDVGVGADQEVGVDVVEFGREGEHQVGDRRATAARQACETVHFRPTLSGLIRSP